MLVPDSTVGFWEARGYRRASPAPAVVERRAEVAAPAVVERPAGNASLAAWQAYVLAVGGDPAEKTRDELRDEHSGD